MSKAEYKRLGDYIRPVDVRNRGLKVHLSQGICNAKYFQNPKQVADNPETHKVVRTGQFAYNRATTRNGEKISIALREGPDCTVSSAYQVFEVVDENLLNPKYLMMWFKRPEFDRLAIYYSHGSAHEFFEWEAMCDVMLPIPSITRQREIVSEYETLSNRIRLNNQMIQHLEATAQTFYRKTFVDNIDKENLPEGWRMGTLGEVAYYVDEKMSLSDIDESAYIATENMLKDKKGIILSTNKPEEGRGTKFAIDDVLVSNIRPYFKKIWRASFNGVSSNDVLCYRAKNEFNTSMLYYTMEQDVFFDYVMAGSNGVKMPRGDKKWIMNYPVIIPSKDDVKEYEKATTCMHLQSVCRKQENEKLTELQSLLLAKMGQSKC